MSSSTQRVAVVTGTSTGFGYLTAERLARAGYRVYGTMRDTGGRNAEPRRALEASGIVVVEADVTDQASVDALARRVLEAEGRVDVVVNNAGTAHLGVTEAFTPESAERQFAVNVLGPIRINRAFLPKMREQGSGLVVFVSSVVGRMLFPFTGIYAASKFALEAYAESLSLELHPFGVDVSLVEPGAYATNIGNAVVLPDDAERVAAYGETGKLFEQLSNALSEQAGDPVEVADAVVALATAAPGARTLRTVVPAGSPVEAINAATAPIQRSVIDAFGFGALLSPEPAAV